ncbi:MAG: flagellar biosynthetic protein FliO [Candidatus Wallbacteria bacterium]|nr:flagellar biosynthetic protein FliO [Candidatus Wallbacteria bacterium]
MICSFLFLAAVASEELSLFTRESRDSINFQPNLNFEGMLLRISVSLALIIGLILVFHFFLSRRSYTQGSEAFRVLECFPLGPKRMLYLVEACERLLILGVTDEQISLITEIDKEQRDLWKIKYEKKSVDFGKLIKGKLSKRQVTVNELQKQIEKLRKINKIS